MAKLAPRYVGPYEIVEKKGPNTYSLMDQEGDMEDLIHAERLKPYFDGKDPGEKDIETVPGGISADTQPPMDPEDMAKSDPPNQIDQTPAGDDPVQAGASDANQTRGRGRPRKNVQIVKKPTVNVPSPNSSILSQIPSDPVTLSPRRTRANLNPISRE